MNQDSFPLNVLYVIVQMYEDVKNQVKTKCLINSLLNQQQEQTTVVIETLVAHSIDFVGRQQ